MTDNEKIARGILNNAIKTLTTARVGYLVYKQRTGDKLELTDDEFINISINYTISPDELKRAFSDEY